MTWSLTMKKNVMPKTLVLFNPKTEPSIEPYQVLPLQVIVDLSVMALNGDTTLSKAPELDLHHQLKFNVLSRILIEGGSYYPAKHQLA